MKLTKCDKCEHSFSSLSIYCPSCSSCQDCLCCPCGVLGCTWCTERLVYQKSRSEILIWIKAERYFFVTYKYKPCFDRTKKLQKILVSLRDVYYGD